MKMQNISIPMVKDLPDGDDPSIVWWLGEKDGGTGDNQPWEFRRGKWRPCYQITQVAIDRGVFG